MKINTKVISISCLCSWTAIFLSVYIAIKTIPIPKMQEDINKLIVYILIFWGFFLTCLTKLIYEWGKKAYLAAEPINEPNISFYVNYKIIRGCLASFLSGVVMFLVAYIGHSFLGMSDGIFLVSSFVWFNLISIIIIPNSYLAGYYFNCSDMST